MSLSKTCSFYKNGESNCYGKGIGYCELDRCRTVCSGDIHFCKKPNALRKHFLEQKKREGTSAWEKRTTLSFWEIRET
jgi:hypothetical protein